jgi:hypothetical protein
MIEAKAFNNFTLMAICPKLTIVKEKDRKSNAVVALAIAILIPF